MKFREGQLVKLRKSATHRPPMSYERFWGEVGVIHTTSDHSNPCHCVEINGTLAGFFSDELVPALPPENV